GAPIVFIDVDDVGKTHPYVLSGNGRVLVLNALAERHLFDRYRNFMKSWAAENGLDVGDGENKVIVRVIDDYGGATREQVADLSNTNSIQQYTEEEQARADAEVIKNLSLARLYRSNADGSPDMTPGANDEFFMRFIQATGDTALYNADRTITETARNRVQRALLAIAVGQGDRGREVVKKLVDRSETLGINRQKNALAVMAADVAALESSADYAIGPDLSRAVADFIDFIENKDTGKKWGTIENYLAQQSLLDGPSEVARSILAILGSRQSAADMAEYIRQYCDAAMQEDPTGGLFVADAARTRTDIWRDAKRTVDERRAKEKTAAEKRFAIRQEEYDRWNDILDKYESGEIDATKDYVVLERTPAVLAAVGAPDNAITLRGGIIQKIVGEIETNSGEHHGIPVSELRSLQIELDNPIAVFDSASRPDALVLLTRMIDRQNNERAIVALLLDRAGSGASKINAIASAYGKNTDAFESWIAKGNLLYINKQARKESARWLQLPGDSTLRARNVLTEKDFTDEQLGRIISNSAAQSQEDASEAFDLFGTPRLRHSVGAVTPEEDAAYADAVKRGDLETARRMEREVYERMGYSDDSSYQGTSAFNGAAPSRNVYFETKAERIEATKNGEMEDTTTLGDYRDGIDVNNLQFIVFDPRSERNADQMRQEAIRNIRGVLDSGAKTITMYRSVPADVKETQFRNGDWITPSRAYAEENAQVHGWGDKFRIIEQEVSVEDVWWDGNDIAEWGFDDGKGSVYKNTAANRKLLGPTYDDAGNLIPLSKRFNDRKNDVRYSLSAIWDDSLPSADVLADGRLRAYRMDFYDGASLNAIAAAEEGRMPLAVICAMFGAKGEHKDFVRTLFTDPDTLPEWHHLGKKANEVYWQNRDEYNQPITDVTVFAALNYKQGASDEAIRQVIGIERAASEKIGEIADRLERENTTVKKVKYTERVKNEDIGREYSALKSEMYKKYLRVTKDEWDALRAKKDELASKMYSWRETQTDRTIKPTGRELQDLLLKDAEAVATIDRAKKDILAAFGRTKPVNRGIDTEAGEAVLAKLIKSTRRYTTPRYSISGIYTGTAADYANRSRQGGVDDGPSLLKIGSGEGSQMYGWGLYGSTKRSVANWYARQGGLENANLKLNYFGDVELADILDIAKKNGRPIAKGDKDISEENLSIEQATAYYIFDEDGVGGAIQFVEKWIERLDERLKTNDKSKKIETYKTELLEILNELRQHGHEYTFGNENIYEQTFFTDRAPGDESHLLKWYEPVSEEQRGWIQDQLLKEHIVTPEAWGAPREDGVFVNYTGPIVNIHNGGDSLYGSLTKLFGSPKAASEFLARAGIDGVKYPVDSFGAKTVKDGDKAGWNYVSFRDDNIRVDHKWTDGQQRYSVTSLGGYGGRLRVLAHGVKEGDEDAMNEAAGRMAALIPDNAVLIPIPSHTGKATTMLQLANAIQALKPSATVLDALEADPHESNYVQKKRLHRPPDAVSMRMKEGIELPQGRPVYFVDNVVASGVTYAAAQKAIPGADIATLTDTGRRKVHPIPTLEELEAVVRQKKAQHDAFRDQYEKKPTHANFEKYTQSLMEYFDAADALNESRRAERANLAPKYAAPDGTRYATRFSKFLDKPISEELNGIISDLAAGIMVPEKDIAATPEWREAMERAKAVEDSIFEKYGVRSTSEIDTPERKAMREKIVEAALSPVITRTVKVEGLETPLELHEKLKDVESYTVARERKACIVTGLPAAGKSSVFANPIALEMKARICDSDAIKRVLPEFDNGYGGNAVHEESTRINEDKVLEAASNRGDNIVYPILGYKPDKLLATIDFFAKKGYTTFLLLNELSPAKATARLITRFLDNGRYLPLSCINKAGDKAVQAFQEVKNEADHYAHVSNDVQFK
ncbi:MAG: zeta toxin family protein, partial [Kiritimatiellae bacterium]|nr:zeta toxin family protein [Kiritimatiellia bacterium]